MKKNYLLGLIIIGLISLSVYSTYAMFTSSVETNDIVSLSASTLPTESEIVEYERLTIKSKEKKVIEYTVNNNTNNSLYYGVWYEMINPSSINDDIVIGKSEDTTNDTLGQLSSRSNAKVLFVIENKTDSNIVVNVGVGYGETSSLNLPTNRYLITEVYSSGILATEYIESLLPSNPTTMNNDDPDGNVRYMGANPNNYVRFNNELWRIIGVFDVSSTSGGLTEKRLKIIRAESIGNYSWDNKPSGTGSSDLQYGSNDWTDSALMEVLNNGAYWNRTSGSCPSGQNGATTSCDFSSNGLTEEAKALIGDAVWNLGGTTSYTSESNGLPSHFYSYERGTNVYTGRPTYWVGKIGLMYPSDYGYATSGGTTTNRASCLAKEMYNWNSSNYSDCKTNDYLYNSSRSQWTITPSANGSFGIHSIAYGSNVALGTPTSDVLINPTIYLKSNILIIDGDGTSENPYILETLSPGAYYITSLVSSNPDTMNNDDPDGNVRYMGPNPNNYVSFNGELWRIIGVFDVASTYGGPTEKRLKIIRNEPIGQYSWDNKGSGTGSSDSEHGSNDWTDSALMEILNNGAYWNRTLGTCPYGQNGATKICNFSSIGLTEEAKALIGDAVWNLGTVTNMFSALSKNWYDYERGATVYSGRPTYWVGKVGLMYPSDYGYATGGGATTNRTSCLSTAIYKWNNSSYSDCKTNDYLYNSNLSQWTMTHYTSSSSTLIYVNKAAETNTNYANITSNAVRPTVYLKSTVSITGGDGSSSNPYTLSL